MSSIFTVTNCSKFFYRFRIPSFNNADDFNNDADIWFSFFNLSTYLDNEKIIVIDILISFGTSSRLSNDNQ